jgi:DNA repair exonuclease SbcCD ATPase subunit
VKIEYISMAGFRAFRDPIRFNFDAGFAVICGRNGVGKSTILDAVDFALTGTLNKFTTTVAKGGGLQEHIWWVGQGAKEHYVSIGFISDNGERFAITRQRVGVPEPSAEKILPHFCQADASSQLTCQALIQTTLIRDELIAADSMDLPGQARFTALQDAIGVIAGIDHSEHTSKLVEAAKANLERARQQLSQAQTRLGMTLGRLTEARSEAAKSSDFATALEFVLQELGRNVASGDQIRAAVAVRRLRVRTLENAFEIAKRLIIDNVEAFRADLETAERHIAQVSSTLSESRERAREAEDALKIERETNEAIAKYTELLAHGAAIGLQDGHCPLCSALRTEKEFREAIDAARTLLAEHGKCIELALERAKNAQDSVQHHFDMEQQTLRTISE